MQPGAIQSHSVENWSRKTTEKLDTAQGEGTDKCSCGMHFDVLYAEKLELSETTKSNCTQVVSDI